jgi:dephospho-CoA kinase
LITVGLTGGLASGKSHVGRILEELGCLWIDADALGHRVLLPGGEAYDAVVTEFGRGILKEDGGIDRQKLAAEVFSEAGRLEKLNSLVHPPVIRLEERMIAEFAAGEPAGIAVVEAAILVETGGHERFDRLIVVRCDPAQQIERAMKRSGETREQVRARLDRQMPVEDKLKLADFVVDTSGSRETTKEQVVKIHHLLRSIKS